MSWLRRVWHAVIDAVMRAGPPAHSGVWTALGPYPAATPRDHEQEGGSGDDVHDR